MKAKLGRLLTTILSLIILYSCMSQEQQEQVLQNSEPQAVDVTVTVGGDSRAERFLGTFDEISRLALDIDRNYGNKRVLTDFPLFNDGSKWTGTINKLIVGFDYTITGHAYKCTDCADNETQSSGGGGVDGVSVVIGDLEWQLATATENDGLSTGLTWNNDKLNWDNSSSYCEGLDLAGQQDWWLPDKDELSSLLDTSVSVPKIVAEFRETTESAYYWSSTGAVLYPSYAWGVSFSYGHVKDGLPRNMSFYVRCVRDYDPNTQSVVDNHTYQEIFRGSTQHTVTEGTNSLNLRLAPLLDDRELTVPRITRINRPFQMVASTSDNITVAVDTVKNDGSSAIDATLSYRFRSVDNESLPLDNTTGGSFGPAEGDVTKSGSSYPDITTTYTAPDNDSTMKLQVRVSNELEIGVTSHFNVYVTDDIETQNMVDTNPVIENISAERLDNGDLKWSMNVSNDDGFSGLKVKWEYLFGDNRTFTNESNVQSTSDSNRGVMQATMSGYQDSDDGMLLVTVCEDGDLPEIPSDCAYMNEASTSISMELIPGAYQQPIICDGDSCSFDYEGTWIRCNTNKKNPGGDDDFATRRETLTIGSGKGTKINEYLTSDDGSCEGPVALTIRHELIISDNGTKKMASLDGDNVSASMFEAEFVSSHLSFNDLSYIQGLKPDNETYLCGESYWTGVEHNVSGCNFKSSSLTDNGTVYKFINHVSDNNTLWWKKDLNNYPDSFGCGGFALDSTGNYIYPECSSSSSSSSSSDDSGPGIVWNMNDDLASENNLNDNGSFVVRLKSQPNNDVTVNLKVVNVLDPNGKDSVDTEITFDQSSVIFHKSLVFGPSNWDQDQTVTFWAIDDDVDEDLQGPDNQSFKVFVDNVSVVDSVNDSDFLFDHSSHRSFSVDNLTARVVDDDTASLVMFWKDNDNSTSEAGGNAFMKVKLGSRPFLEDDTSIKIRVVISDQTEAYFKEADNLILVAVGAKNLGEITTLDSGFTTGPLGFYKDFNFQVLAWDNGSQAMEVVGLDDFQNDGDVINFLTASIFSSTDPVYGSSTFDSGDNLTFINVDNDSETTCEQSSYNVNLMMDGSTPMNLVCNE